ncbi:DUF2075 domain-containing protein [Amycolatopsis oliviviridis]|uniref:DUF2075 domain-containing protein n=1 Tax=Amycolatopsis oliviviridis TaxID=1471590 RepID=UPI0017497347|nr:DUF2075 domain-containing protein [Amycolatopsis oliviviridis]
MELTEAGLGEIDALANFRLPYTSAEFDLLLAGVHPQTGKHSYVAIEMKGWLAARPEHASGAVVKGLEGLRHTIHPVIQLDKMITYFRERAVASDQPISGLVWLPQARDADVCSLHEFESAEGTRVFTPESRAEMADFVRTRLAPDPSRRAVETLSSSPVREPHPLLVAAANEFKGYDEYVFLGNQELARSAVLEAAESGVNETLIVSGRPATGKSAIAISLLAELARRGYSVTHATGSRPATSTWRKVVGTENPGTKVRGLFTYFNNYSGAEPRGLDVLICDEAHRVRDTSATRYTRRDQRTGVPQVVELIQAAKVSVFFLDPEQALRPGEIGTEELIASAAVDNGRTVRRITLDEQFGADGSSEYLAWTRLLLDEQRHPLPIWTGDREFTVEIADTPQEMEARIRQQDLDGTSRIVAGLCWPWSEAKPGENLPLDIQIGDWARPWSVKGDRGVNGAPSSSHWASDPAGIGQIGSVYNVQGFEFDWTGVILGPDLVWRTDRWVAQRTENLDFGLNRLDDHAFDKHIRRTYRVLLSRSRKGTIVYSTDPETRHMLHKLVRSKAH